MVSPKSVEFRLDFPLRSSLKVSFHNPVPLIFFFQVLLQRVSVFSLTMDFIILFHPHVITLLFHYRSYPFQINRFAFSFSLLFLSFFSLSLSFPLYFFNDYLPLSFPFCNFVILSITVFSISSSYSPSCPFLPRRYRTERTNKSVLCLVLSIFPSFQFSSNSLSFSLCLLSRNSFLFSPFSSSFLFLFYTLSLVFIPSPSPTNDTFAEKDGC